MNKKNIIIITVALGLIAVASLILLNQNNKGKEELLNKESTQATTSSETTLDTSTLSLEKDFDTSDACESACGYYLLCLSSKKPNIINETSLNNQYDSCLKECAKWDTQKTECIITSPNCEDIVTKCGLQ